MRYSPPPPHDCISDIETFYSQHFSFNLFIPAVDEYITLAKDKYGYNTEQALGMLFWHKHSVEKSLADLPNFTPFPDEWTVEDRVLFEQAFSFHGKSFHRIRQMVKIWSYCAIPIIPLST